MSSLSFGGDRRRLGAVAVTMIVAGLVLVGGATAGASSDISAPFGRGLGRFTGRGTPGANAGDAQTLSSTSPQWLFDGAFGPDTGLDDSSTVYDLVTDNTIIFAGIDAGLGLLSSNAVLLHSNANGLGGPGSFSTLIANGSAGSPLSRFGQSAEYDSANNRMMVFAGCRQLVPTSQGLCSPLLNDAWVMSSANGQGGTPTWTQLTPSGSPPAARAEQRAVYDAANNRLITFGGGTLTQGFNDVWVLTNANGLGGVPTWTQLSPAGGPPSITVNTSAVYDPANNIMTVFGGQTLSGVSETNAVWTLSHANGLGGTPQWTNIVVDGAAGAPTKREGHSAVYDVTNNRMTIFGGSNFSQPGTQGFNDVWVLTNANGMGGAPVWTKLKTTGQAPGVRFRHNAVYDAANNRMIVFAGVNADAQFYGDWILTHANGL